VFFNLFYFHLKQFVPNELKDEKYWARRRKNNMAAKRSRDARRMKENQIAITASYLERENELLRKQLEDSKRETKLLKAKLARYEAIIPMDGSAK
jgi:leukemia factor-related protein